MDMDVEVNPGPASQDNYMLGHPNLCGFYRTCIYKVFRGEKLIPSSTKNEADLEEGINDAKTLFGSYFGMVEIDFSVLKKNHNRLINTVKKWGKNRGREDQKMYLETFLPKNWLAMDDEDQSKHSVLCKECETSFLEIHSKFPCSSRALTAAKCRLTDMVQERDNSQADLICKKMGQDMKEIVHSGLTQLQENGSKLGKRLLKKVASTITESSDSSFLEKGDTSFEESYNKLKRLQVKPTYEEKRKMERNIVKEVVKEIEANNNKNCTDRLYGSDMSLRQWDAHIMKTSFITVPEAIALAEKNKEKIKAGIKKPKDHVGHLDSYDIDRPGLIAEAKTWDESTDVKWKPLAERYVKRLKVDEGSQTEIKVTPSNGGQIVQKVLQDAETAGELDLMYKSKGKEQKVIVRRSMKKLKHNVSTPKEKKSVKVRAQMMREVQDGVIDLGEPIVKRKYSKYYIGKDGKIKHKEFFIEARKHPLSKLRRKLLKKTRKYMRLNDDLFFERLTDEELKANCKSMGLEDADICKMSSDSMRVYLKTMERTRNLKMWHDGSAIANHGHLLFCVSLLYDPKVFFTSNEFFKKSGKKINVQQKVESPEVYIIGRCRSNDEQVAYIPTRLDCLKDLKNGIKIINESNIEIRDTMRLFCGDGPAMSMEAGNQKGGIFFCTSCSIHKCQTDNIACTYQQKHRSFSDRIQEVLKGRYGRYNSAVKKDTHPFKNLTKEQLREELSSRKIDITGLKVTKKDLVPKLKSVLRGIIRVPILLINDPLADLLSIGLTKYEVAMLECMHDVANHIENILLELPHHLTEPHRGEVERDVKLLTKEKDLLRCCDKRRMLLILTENLEHKIDGKVHRLLKSLSEIQRILYLGDDFRTPREILRLHNCCFQHFVLMKELFDLSELSAAMTRDRLFGKYQHNLLVHSPIQYRLISGVSVACEEEERIFNILKGLTKGKSNFRDNHVIGNMIVRSQYKSRNKELYEFDTEYVTCINDIQRAGKEVDKSQMNSLFEFEYIRTHSDDWQAHLERISDFLVFGEGVWWQKTDFGIEFFDRDSPNEIFQQPKVHHFRNDNIKTVISDLKKHWSTILQARIPIPVNEIWEGDENEPARSTVAHYLEDRFHKPVQDFVYSEISDTNTVYPYSLPCNDSEDDLSDFALGHSYYPKSQELDLQGEDIYPSGESFETASYEEVYPEITDDVDFNFAPTETSEDQVTEEASSSSISPAYLHHHQHTSSICPTETSVEVASTSSISPSHLHHQHTSSISPTETSEDQVTEEASTSSISPEHLQHQHIHLKTREAMAVYKVLKCMPDAIQKYDRKKDAFKKNPGKLISLDDVLDMRAPLQTLTLKTMSSLKQDLKEWEKTFMLQNDFRVPSQGDVEREPAINDIQSRIATGEQLLQAWGIHM